MPYAIMNRRTRKFIYSTDFGSMRQMTDKDIAIVFKTREEAEIAMKFRSCGKDYVAVAVRIEAIE